MTVITHRFSSSHYLNKFIKGCTIEYNQFFFMQRFNCAELRSDLRQKLLTLRKSLQLIAQCYLGKNEVTEISIEGVEEKDYKSPKHQQHSKHDNTNLFRRYERRSRTPCQFCWRFFFVCDSASKFPFIILNHQELPILNSGKNNMQNQTRQLSV